MLYFYRMHVQSLFISVLLFAACNEDAERSRTAGKDDGSSGQGLDSSVIIKEKNNADKKAAEGKSDTAKKLPIKQSSKVYSNERFKEVRVEKIGDSTFRIRGKGQIFEASFGWVVEDGHEELKNGYEMTRAGAPEWGDFDFKVGAAKKRPNSTLHLILYESSAKDGSRQFLLPLFLY